MKAIKCYRVWWWSDGHTHKMWAKDKRRIRLAARRIRPDDHLFAIQLLA